MSPKYIIRSKVVPEVHLVPQVAVMSAAVDFATKANLLATPLSMPVDSSCLVQSPPLVVDSVTVACPCAIIGCSQWHRLIAIVHRPDPTVDPLASPVLGP